MVIRTLNRVRSISVATILLTLIIATHEPPSRVHRAIGHRAQHVQRDRTIFCPEPSLQPTAPSSSTRRVAN